MSLTPRLPRPAILVALAFLIIAPGHAARAVPNPDPAVQELANRLNNSNPDAWWDPYLTGKVKQRLNEFLQTRFPTQPDAKVEAAFIDNLRARFSAMSDAQLQALRNDLSADPADFSTRLSQRFDAVAFFTVAGDRVLQRDAAQQTSELDRLPYDAPRRADAYAGWTNDAASWDAVEARFAAYSAAREREFEEPWREFYVDESNPSDDVANDLHRQASARMDRDTWIDRLAARLERLYGRDDNSLEPGFLRDVASIQYAMFGLRMVGSSVEPVAVDLLRPLDAQLADDTLALEDALLQRERDRGFRDQRPVASGLISPDDFPAVIAAGHPVQDPGAGIYHGDFAHSVQQSAAMTEYDRNISQYSSPPAETYTRIGAYDQLQRHPQRFGFEAPRDSLWYHVFDHSGENPAFRDLSHPDSVRDLANQYRSRLPNLADRLQDAFDRRLARAEELYAFWEPNYNDLGALQTMMPHMTQAMMQEAETHWNRIAEFSAYPDLAERARVLTADYLYQQEYYQSLRNFGFAQMSIRRPDGTLDPIPLLTTGATELERNPPVDKLALERQRHNDLQARLQAPPPNPPAAADESFDPAPLVGDVAARVGGNDDDDNDSDLDQQGVFSDDDSDLPFAARAGAGDDDDESGLEEDDLPSVPSAAADRQDQSRDSPYPKIASDEPVSLVAARESPPISKDAAGEVALRAGEVDPDDVERRGREAGRERESEGRRERIAVPNGE